MNRRRAALGLALAASSGLLYGAGNVAVKLVGAHPLVQAGVGYLVGGALLSPTLRGIRIAGPDWPKILAMALIGGGLSPALLFYGLRHASVVDAGLLLTLELAATAVLAVLFLGEREGGRGWLGIASLGAAAMVVALAGGDDGATSPLGIALVSAAALGWGIDNAVSTRLMGSYSALQLVGLKGLIGGGATFTLALVVDAPVPPGLDLVRVAMVGLVGVCASSVVYYQALAFVGAARTSALNVPLTALAGAVGGLLVLHETLGWLHAVAFAFVAAGATLLAIPHAAPPPAPPSSPLPPSPS